MMDQLERDIAFCIDECDMNDEQIGDMLRACENLGGIAVEYFVRSLYFTQTIKRRWIGYTMMNI